jgi:CheY-like chemotaxis protein
VLADDNGQILSLVSEVLVSQCEIVGEAVNGEEAIETTLRLKPEILILDISMPRLNGIEVARRLADSGLAVKIVFLTSLEDREYVAAALKLGAPAYVLKKLLRTDLPLAIAAVLEGRTFYSGMPSSKPSDSGPDTAALDMPQPRELLGPVSGSIFSPGQIAPFSGIYLVIHDRCHPERHYATVLYGDVFPPCATCTSAVRFELALSAVYVRAHPFFQQGS